jgi:DNA modification methylase
MSKIKVIGTNTLYCGNCFDVFPEIPNKSVNLILCDPPYGTTANTWDSELDLENLWNEYRRILAPKGNILLFGTGMFAFKLALSNPKMFRYDLIWKKSKCGSPFTAKYMPMKKHELILVFGEPAATYNPQMDEGTPYKRKWTPNKSNNMKFGISGTEHLNEGTRHPTTILDFPQHWRRQDQIHPTQKPVELCKWLVQSYSNPGDTVIDNCMGSNTTGLACQMLGDREYIGIEIQEEYYKKSIERIEKFLWNLLLLLQLFYWC